MHTRKILRRKKEGPNNKAAFESKQGTLPKGQQSPSKETLKAGNTGRQRFRTGLRRTQNLSKEGQTIATETNSRTDITTTTVNPVLIWRQQAAVTEQAPRRSGSGQRGRSGSLGRRINIKRKNDGRQIENRLEKSE